MNAQKQNQSKEQDAKHEAEKAPGKDDVHEQREQDQPKEGLVEQK